jgi:hypothetical protein
VDADIEQVIKDAVWAYTHAERDAGLQADASVLAPVATPRFVDIIAQAIEGRRQRGVAYVDSPRLDIEFRSIRSMGQNCVEAQLVLVAMHIEYDEADRVIRSLGPVRAPQRNYLVLEGGTWKFNAMVFFPE